jgi:hypothetical protein
MICEHEYMNMCPPPNYRSGYGTEMDTPINKICKRGFEKVFPQYCNIMLHYDEIKDIWEE